MPAKKKKSRLCNFVGDSQGRDVSITGNIFVLFFVGVLRPISREAGRIGHQDKIWNHNIKDICCVVIYGNLWQPSTSVWLQDTGPRNFVVGTRGGGVSIMGNTYPNFFRDGSRSFSREAGKIRHQDVTWNYKILPFAIP